MNWVLEILASDMGESMRAVTLSSELVDQLRRILQDRSGQRFDYHAEEHLFALLEQIEERSKSDEAFRKELARLADQTWEHIRRLYEMTYPDQPPIEVD